MLEEIIVFIQIVLYGGIATFVGSFWGLWGLGIVVAIACSTVYIARVIKESKEKKDD